MPQRSPKPAPSDRTSSAVYADHYFDSAHGDVAALHARIERDFANAYFGEMPFSSDKGPIDNFIILVSRSAGIVGLAATMVAILYWLI